MADLTLATVIVDDEPLARRRLRRLLREVPGVKVVGECDSGVATLELLESTRADLLVLDIQMPGLSGFDLLDAIPAARRPAVIFVTAHDAYAIRAFEARAVDYVLKPAQVERLREAVSRVAERLRSAAPAPSAPRYAVRLPVAQGPRLVPVDLAAIDWIQAAGNYVHLHMGNRSMVHRSPLTDLERTLDPVRFVRIHRSAIVNAERVAHVTPLATGDYEVEMKTGTKLRLSRTRRAALGLLLTGRGS